MTFMEAVKTCFRKYVTFRGRAPRSEFWWFMLFNFLVASGLFIIGKLIANYGDNLYLSSIFQQDKRLSLQGRTLLRLGYMLYQVGVVLYLAGAALPTWSVACRRLHDINRTGWWLIVPSMLTIIGLFCMTIAFADGSEDVAMLGVLFGFAGLVTAIVILVFYCLAGTPGPNQYGPNPLEDGYQSNDNASNYNDSNYSGSVDLAKSEDSSRTIDLSKY